MAEPNESGRSTVLVERAALQALVRASRRNVDLAYAAGGIAGWAAFVLAVSEGAVSLWVVAFGLVGIAFLGWGFRTSRSLGREHGPAGTPPPDGPFPPIPYVDRQHSIWREAPGGLSGDPGRDLPGS
jgi:hypothetical protein